MTSRERGAEYDPAALKDAASRLLRRADLLVVTYTLAGGVIGTALGHYLAQWARSDVLTLLGTLLFAFVGRFVGRGRAFHLKLHVQAALCQARIEENTRPPSHA